MTAPTREDLELYVMGLYDGDIAALEAHLANDPAAREIVAKEAELEVMLRDAAAAATFCPACDDVVAGARCEACGAALRAGGYEIERVLVQNAHGRMYLARDVDGKQVALKELAFVQSPSADALAAFEREARFLRALEHAAIPRFVASFQEGKGVHTRYYLAQELVTGQSLDARMADHWYDEREIVDIARQVLTVLSYLQSLSPMIVHRDIKPANLIRREDGTVLLVDFGAAYDQGATVGSTAIGTFGYMPLEQMAGQIDATTDPYALGASLLHLLTRREPWSFLQEPDFASVNVSEPVRAFLKKLIAADRRDRFAGAAAALQALEAAARGEMPAAPPKKVTPLRRWWRPALLAAAAIGIVGGGLAIKFGREPHSPAPHAEPAAATTVPAPAPVPTVEIAPAVTVLPVPESLPAGKTIDLSFNQASETDVFRSIGAACGLNIVIPDSVRFQTTVTLESVPCDQALEVLLESRGLWYRYTSAGNLLRISPRRQLDMEMHAAIERARVRAELGLKDDVLPEGREVAIELKNAPVADVLKTLADAGDVNVVLSDAVGGSVTLIAKSVQWRDAVRVVLESQSLGYRYRENGKILMVAPQRELDMEDHASRERRRITEPQK